jgi:hypothetical protein
MTKLKIYTKNKPVTLTGHLETYNISDGVKSNSVWYSEVITDNYFNTRTELEKEGFIAHPSSVKEIESRIYTIFKETTL